MAIVAGRRDGFVVPAYVFTMLPQRAPPKRTTIGARLLLASPFPSLAQTVSPIVDRAAAMGPAMHVATQL